MMGLISKSRHPLYLQALLKCQEISVENRPTFVGLICYNADIKEIQCAQYLFKRYPHIYKQNKERLFENPIAFLTAK